MPVNRIAEIWLVTCDTCGVSKEMEVTVYGDLKSAMGHGTETLHFVSEEDSLEVICSTCKRKG